MSKKIIAGAFLISITLSAVSSAASDEIPMVSFPSVSPVAAAPSASAPSDRGPITIVAKWIKERAPNCPSDSAAAAAADFLSELREQHPDLASRISAPDFPVKNFESPLLRVTAAHLPGPAYAALREELARRRVQALLTRLSLSPGSRSTDPEQLIAKIKALSEVRYQSLMGGRMDDDDLAFYLQRTKENVSVSAAKPQGQSADEIVSEYSRRNQAGSSMQHWQASLLEARLKTVTGSEQDIVIFKQRPNRFRLSVSDGGAARFVQAGDGNAFWQAVPGRPVQPISAEAIGERRYLGEFADPLLAREGYAFERLADGEKEGKHFFRISVRRVDGSKYVSRIDAQSYRQIGREEDNGSIASFSDFREVAGVTFPFREEVIDRQGRKATLAIVRNLANPGLIQAFFEAPPEGEQNFFDFEHLLAAAPSP